MSWKIVAASVTGKSHLDQNQPCQDAHHHAVVQGVLLAVICDGAGSAAESQRGAACMSQQVVRGLSDRVHSGALPSLQAANREAFIEVLRTVIAQAREQLVSSIAPPTPQTPQLPPAPESNQWPQTGVTPLAQTQQEQQQQQQEAGRVQATLRDFACTLVGCAASEDGGFFFHIGDGFAIYQQASGLAQLSLPENGEYADETYFVTDHNWREHLRITSLEPLEADSFLGLMSDGPAPFAVNKSKTAFYLPFIEPVMRFLRAAPQTEGCLALKNLLENEKTHHITGDDKSLLLAFKP